MTDENTASQPFSSSLATTILHKACKTAHLSTAHANLIRLGENALFHLPDSDTVVRIARSTNHWEDAVKEVAVSEWLNSKQFPAAKTCDVPQPISTAGHPVTFWQYIDGRNGNRSDIASLGQLLHRLHSTPAPTAFRLPHQSILDRVEQRIESASVPNEDKYFLLDRCDHLKRDLIRLAFPLSPGPAHGDAHVQNLMISGDETTLIDFERFAWGQPEWDLAMTATEYVSAGWWTDDEYQTFVDAYGYDVTEWTGFDVLRATHELKMTTWLMQNIAESPKIADEYTVRMRTIRAGRPVEAWQPF